MMRKLGLALQVVTLLLAMSLPAPLARAEAGGAELSGNMDFRGYVRRASMGMVGVPNVTVQLWLYAPPYVSNWTVRATAVTDATGRFALHDVIGWAGDPPPEHYLYHIVKTNPPGYTSVSAQQGACPHFSCEASSVIGADTIHYTLWDSSGVYDYNLFFVTSPGPEVVDVIPANGSSAAGLGQSFVLRARDANGGGEIRVLDLEVDDACGYPYADAIHISLQPLSNRLYLMNDDGTTAQEYILPGPNQWGAGTRENAQCVLHLDESRYWVSGQELNLEVGIHFKDGYRGDWKLCGRAKDSSDQAHSKELGVWRVLAPPTATATATSTATATPTRTATRTATPTSTPGTAGSRAYLPYLRR